MSERKVNPFIAKLRMKAAKSVVNLVNCAKCGKAIEAGKEVRKGWIAKKPYHAECAPK